ncbi:MAG: hypothetical protein FWF10_02765 [Clostridiales bacterium]|nr:hypothetical protein [Clostridiales bacterium]
MRLQAAVVLVLCVKADGIESSNAIAIAMTQNGSAIAIAAPLRRLFFCIVSNCVCYFIFTL